MSLIQVVGIDMAFANMGIARGNLDTERGLLNIHTLTLVQTEAGSDAKVVRKSSTELRRAQELRAALARLCEGASLAFAEVPSGSQSASAARALGIAVGVLASCPIPVIEVSPREVKLVVMPGSKGVGVPKAQVIEWAAKRWPGANWRRAEKANRSKNGLLPAGRLLDDNEHCADACAAIVAGIATNEFTTTLRLSTHALPSPAHIGSSSGGRRVRLL